MGASNRLADDLDNYLKLAAVEPLLSHAEACDLVRLANQGDGAARDRMIRANLRLVVTTAKDFQSRGLEIGDLIGEGNLGLINAVKNFDPELGIKFSTYARFWIRQAILGAIYDTSAAIRLPRHMVSLLIKWSRMEQRLRCSLNRPPLFSEVSGALKLTDRRCDLVRDALRSRCLHRDGADEESLLVDLPGREERDQVDPITPRLKYLNSRERAIITQRFGLEQNDPSTLSSIGKSMGITRTWVHKLELRALGKMRQSFELAG